MTDVTNLKLILYLFEGFSGVSINFPKRSLVYFEKFANRGTMLASVINCPLEFLPFNYLGLPLLSGRIRNRDWQPIIDKFYNKLSCWKGSSLSIGGRVILINSVFSALPLYYLSFFKLPSWVIKKIDGIRRNFFWDGNRFDTSPFKHLVNWESVCFSKVEEGLDIINLKLFNCFLLCKWLWKART